MLRRSIPERALGALFGGDLAATVLRRHLAGLLRPDQCQLKMAALRRDLSVAIQQDIDHRTGGVLRLNETSPAVQSLCDEALLHAPDIPTLDAAFDAVLQFTPDGAVEFKDVRVQQYAQTLAELDPTVLVAWRLVCRSEAKGNGKQASLETAVDRLRPLFVGPHFDGQPFAENHVHLAGVTGSELVLAHVVLGQTIPQAKSEHKDVLRRVRRIRRVLSSLATDLWPANGDVDKELIKRWVAQVLPAIPDGDKEAVPDSHVDWGTLARGLSSNGNGQAQVCSNWLVWKLGDTASRDQYQAAWIWLFIALWRTYRSDKMNVTARAVILLVISDIMVLRRRLLMDGNGLRRFTTQCFESPVRDVAKQRARWEESSSEETARRIFARRGDKAAIKVRLDSLGKAWLPALACNANKVIRMHECDSALSHEQSRNYWHLCAHFNRVKEEQPRRQLWELAKTLRDDLHSYQAWPITRPAGHDGNGLEPEFEVFPSQIIRGLDVVGDETRWPIERFAPMLRWLRSPEAAPGIPRKLPEGPGQRPEPQLHLSIHAGEDYAHPLSGLRHVDETVDFCEMGAGDRLGHALALGIPPDEWLRRHGDVTLPLDEHVDNLIWAWRRAVDLGDPEASNLDEARCVLPRLKKRIERLLPHVSWYPPAGGDAPLTEKHLQHLHEAWALRKNCPYKVLQQAGNIVVEDTDLAIGAPDWLRLRAALDGATTDTAEGLYVLRANHEANPFLAEKKPAWRVCVAAPRHGHVTRRQHELENLSTEAITAEAEMPIPCLHDHDDADDLRFMLALQDACLERYAQLGLAIEANPSSNVYIGQLQTHSDHPIYRWNPPDAADLNKGRCFNLFGLRSKPMPVTINTDDPGMIPTTLRLEHHLIHEGAIDRGYSEQKAAAWIEKLRQFGLDLFDAAHK
ncbi:hypothetical protein QRD43_03435 [Pelomonas sp. APW6]|uniref:Adenosine deaminase n=1 Tax=Roseateles subflavus TaxID=3053353 RepID=A0ABT7LDL1_9BURK|nr:hypothetical protein [Pelomonas sp. APW6]MDL5030948.1 hypothetical protein [Pelomonas sp. APW6]